MSAPLDAPGEESWTEIVPHRPDVMLEGLEVFRSHCVLLEREGGLPRMLRGATSTAAEGHAIAFPEPAYSVFPGANAEFDTTLFRYSYESLVTPRSIFDYDMAARTSTLLKEQPVLGGYDRDELPLGAALRHGARRREGPDLPRLPRRTGSARTARTRSTSPATAPTATPCP